MVFWTAITAANIGIVALAVALYFNWAWGYSVTLWLYDTTYSVLQSWGI